VSIYHSFSRDPTAERLRDLQIVLRIMANSTPEKVRNYYAMSSSGADLFLKYHKLEAHRTSNELQLTVLLASIGYWRQRTDDDLAVVHDQSSNFFRQAALWDAITGSHVPQQQHPLADGSSVQFPLRVTSTNAANSIDHKSIQFCDVLAGLFTRHLRQDNSTDDRAFLDEVKDAGLGEIMCDGIRAGLEFPNGPPQRLNGPDIIDQMQKIMPPPG